MGSGWAVAVTVVGGASIVALLGLLGRYLGVWTWALAWVRAAREEKVHLCRTERNTSTRSYLFDSDLDWIGLWPRTGSYKRFTNLDDLPSVPSMDDSIRQADEPDLPPQPLRPAPAPPPRLPGWSDSGGEGSASPASSVGGFGAGVETPPEPSRPAPVLDRRDSNRSLTGRLSRRDSSKELLAASQQSSPKRPSTNPFRASWVPPDEASEAPLAQNTVVEEARPVQTTEGLTLVKGADYHSPPSYGATTAGAPPPPTYSAVSTAPPSTAVITSAATAPFYASSSTAPFTVPSSTAVCTAPASTAATTSFYTSPSTAAFTAPSSTAMFTAPVSTTAFTPPPSSAAFAVSGRTAATTSPATTVSFYASSSTAAFTATPSTATFTAPACAAGFTAPASTAALTASSSTAVFTPTPSTTPFTVPASTAAFTAAASTTAFTAPLSTAAFTTTASTSAFTASLNTAAFTAKASTTALTTPASTTEFTSPASTGTAVFTPPASTAPLSPASTLAFTSPTSTAAFTATASTAGFTAPASTAGFTALASTRAFTSAASTEGFTAPANTKVFTAPASTTSFYAPSSTAVFTAPASTAAFTASLNALSFQTSSTTAAFSAPPSTVTFTAAASTAVVTAAASTTSFYDSSGAAFSSSSADLSPFSHSTLSFTSTTTAAAPPAPPPHTAVTDSSLSHSFSGNLMDLNSPIKPEEGEGVGGPGPLLNGPGEGHWPGEGKTKEAGKEGMKAARDFSSPQPQQPHTSLAPQANGVVDSSDRANSDADNISQDITSRKADTGVTKSYVLQNYESPSGTNEVFASGPSSGVFSYDRLSSGVSTAAPRPASPRTGEPLTPQVSTELSSRDSVGSPELGRSYEVPATPPNTATNPYSPHSPHISSRLAEVEARMKQLGATMEHPRDTSQDWWPTDTSSRREQTLQGSRDSGKNTFFGSVDSGGGERQPGGLGRVEEEVSSTEQSESGVGVLGDMEDEDESTRRVREYIASLSARLRQLPDEEDLMHGPLDHLGTPPPSTALPITPPHSATKSFSQGSTETPPSSAGPFSAFSSTRATVSGTPPSSAGLRGSFTSRRASMDASLSPVSPGLGINRRLSLDTPPSSAGLVTSTPPNSAASLATFADTPPSSAGYSSSGPNSADLSGSFDGGMAGGPGHGSTLKRAMSCDSVSSDTSVTLGELEDTFGQVTGQLAVQLIYDRSTRAATREGREVICLAGGPVWYPVEVEVLVYSTGRICIACVSLGKALRLKNGAAWRVQR
ncbi:mucin-2-like isoform X2 [Scylla paramamosain]